MKNKPKIEDAGDNVKITFDIETVAIPNKNNRQYDLNVLKKAHEDYNKPKTGINYSTIKNQIGAFLFQFEDIRRFKVVTQMFSPTVTIYYEGEYNDMIYNTVDKMCYNSNCSPEWIYSTSDDVYTYDPVFDEIDEAISLIEDKV